MNHSHVALWVFHLYTIALIQNRLARNNFSQKQTQSDADRVYFRSIGVGI